MGETSVYYVPQQEQRWIGRELEAAQQFWTLGVFLVTPDNWAYQEIERFKREGRPLPPWRHTFSFASMGIGGLGQWDPVPNSISEQSCPFCGEDITDAMYEVWVEENPVPLPERSLSCPHCSKAVQAGAGVASEAFVFSRFYLWVSDIDEGDWQPDFQQTVEQVLGPCNVFQGWET